VSLWLYRVPLSEDGPLIDVAWGALLAGAAAGAGAGGAGGGEGLGAALASADSEDVRDASANAAAATAAAKDAPPADADDADGDAARVRAALRGRHVVSRADGALEGADAAVPGAGSGFIRVGFAIIDLACEPVREAGGAARAARAGAVAPPPPRLLAAAADSGVVYLLRFGSNAVARTLVGHRVVGGAVGAATRLAWLPPPPPPLAPSCLYLAATSDADHALVLFSVGSGRVAARLGREAGGHSGAVKGLRALADAEGGEGEAGEEGGAEAAAPKLLSCGFDKRCIVWR
jgi:hypothetical protein